ncbi:hypothetical protein QR721_03290 [Aciduricibacillus chroicocephali]|uniref:Uncharacterized protein n=1 Tax=Aciduricibacillus chroicocephali TaxID=3054939 RepID=A0ABY9KWM9_9BACI|nr:hypothetical protein QR721_03290 [Bacillaceae bacterium 44XB]
MGTSNNNNTGNTGMWIAAGVAVTGLSLVLLNRNARNKVMDTSMSMKDTAMDYASNVKNDPSGVKSSLIDRIKTTSSITMEAVSKIQDILNNEGKDLKETANTLVKDSKQMINHAMEAKETLLDAKDKSMEAKDKAMEAKDNVMEAKDDIAPDSKGKNDSNLRRVGGEQVTPAVPMDSVQRTGANKGNDAQDPIKR